MYVHTYLKVLRNEIFRMVRTYILKDNINLIKNEIANLEIN